MASEDAVFPDHRPLSKELGSLVNWFVRENSRRLDAAKQRLQRWCQQRCISYLQADAGKSLIIFNFNVE